MPATFPICPRKNRTVSLDHVSVDEAFSGSRTAVVFPVSNLCESSDTIVRHKTGVLQQLHNAKQNTDIKRLHTGEVIRVGPVGPDPEGPEGGAYAEHPLLLLAGVVPSFRPKYMNAAENALNSLTRHALAEAIEAGCERVIFLSFSQGVGMVCNKANGPGDVETRLAHVMFRTVRAFLDTHLGLKSDEEEGEGGGEGTDSSNAGARTRNLKTIVLANPTDAMLRVKRVYFPESEGDQVDIATLCPSTAKLDRHGGLRHAGRSIRVSAGPGAKAELVSGITPTKSGWSAPKPNYASDEEEERDNLSCSSSSSSDDEDSGDDEAEEGAEEGERGEGESVAACGGEGPEGRLGGDVARTRDGSPVKAAQITIAEKCRDQSGKDVHTEYTVEIGSLTVQRRYSQFYSLWEQLKVMETSPLVKAEIASAYSTAGGQAGEGGEGEGERKKKHPKEGRSKLRQLQFPTKKLFSSLKRKVVARRRLKLQRFLDTAMAHESRLVRQTVESFLCDSNPAVPVGTARVSVPVVVGASAGGAGGRDKENRAASLDSSGIKQYQQQSQQAGAAGAEACYPPARAASKSVPNASSTGRLKRVAIKSRRRTLARMPDMSNALAWQGKSEGNRFIDNSNL